MSKISDLAQALHQKTMEKKIKWDISDDTSIITNIGMNSIVVTQFEDPGDIVVYNISVQNIDGKTIDQENFFRSEEVYKFIAEMTIKARRDSLRADETLDELMAKISGL